MTLEIHDRSRGLLRELLAAGFNALHGRAYAIGDNVQIRRLTNLVEGLRRQLDRPQEDMRRPLRPPVATTHA